MRQPIQPGSQRFEVRRQLGRGGMGTVYEAFDHERGIPVALKLLHEATPDALFRFKQEFRSLADVRHPNLVTLYELLAIDGEWLFTMELIEGVDLIDHLRPRDPEAPDPEPEPVSPSSDEDDTRSLAVEAQGRPSDTAGGEDVDFVRVRELFLQLALGVRAIHDTGHVHRDIKPSNILVTPTGRVVLLDFGVIGLAAADSETVARKRVVGTPRYMAPEQMQANAPPSPVNDWYAFGLVLYEALTGRRAFSGTFDGIRGAKLAGAFVPLDAIDARIPADLEHLCTALLRPDPAARPTAAQVLEALGDREVLVGGTGADVPVLVGRAAELALLEKAFERVRAAEGGVVQIAGGSGIGKSSLVRAFLDRLVEHDAVVLAGRCHEHEEVPYKGVDRLVDELSRLLAMLPRDEVTPLVPQDAQALARVFPVLRRVEAIAALPPWLGSMPEPIELRRRAFDEMRELLSRLARRAPLVLFIDDFQWADPDSAALLAELMRPPRVPPLLLIISARSEDPTMVANLTAKLPASPPPWLAWIELAPLTRDAARSLLDAANVDADAADQLVVESGGNPYFLQELLRGASARRTDSGALTLDQMLLERVTALPAGARALIELVSVAGKPTPSAVIRTALDEVASEPLGAALWPTRRQQLLRSRDVDGADLLEPYHDRVREAVVAAMDGERRKALHQALASAMQGIDSPDIEALATHLEGAGEAFAAASGYARAADVAADILAFDRAAALYQRSLQLAPIEGVDGATRLAALADALANAGRGTEAAAAYQRAVALLEEADTEHALTLQCRARAAEELLRSGHIDDGLEALAAALAPVGLTLPRNDLASLVWHRALVRLRGTRFRPRPPEEVPARELLRIEVAATAAAALSMTAHLKGAVFQCRHLLDALRAGHSDHIARGLGFEAIFASLQRRPARKRVQRLVERASELAEQRQDPQTVALVRASHSLSSYQFGQWETCVENSRIASALLRRQCTGVWSVLNSIEMYELWGLYYLGQLSAMSTKVSAMLRAAVERGDLYLVATLSTGLPNLAWLMRDDADGARGAVRASMEGWSRHGYHLQHHWMWFALVNADIYAGDGAAALRRVESGWRALERSMLLNIQMVRIEAYDLRARAALAAAARADGTERARSIATARAASRRLQSIRIPIAAAAAAMHTAGIAELTGRSDEAVAALRQAAALAEEGRNRLHRAVVDARLGELAGEPHRRDEALAWLAGEGIAAPQRFATLLYPVQ